MLPHVEVVLYQRRGCHLCEEVLPALERARRQFGFSFALRDIEDDPEWLELYREHVPVVTVEGKVRFRGAVNEVMLRRLLRKLHERHSAK